MREEEEQVGHRSDRSHDEQEHIQGDHDRSLSEPGVFSNRLAHSRGRFYGSRVKNAKDKQEQTRPGDTLEEHLGPEIDEALLALDELATDDPEEALATFDTLPEPVQALVDFQLLAARAHQALGELDTSRDMLLALLDLHPQNADVHHQLGDVSEDLGDIAKANEHFEKTRVLDLASYEKLPMEERRKGEDELEQALASIDSTLKNRDFRFSVETLPSPADVILGVDPRALCHYRKETKNLVAYAANLVFEFGDLTDEEERREALIAGLLEYAADDLDLSAEELELFGLISAESDED